MSTQTPPHPHPNDPNIIHMDPIIQTEKSTLYLGKFPIEPYRQSIYNLPLIKNPQIIVCGKPATCHRSFQFFSNTSEGYRFSRQLAKSLPLTPELNDLLNTINDLFGENFNGILVNRYETGEDYIGKHSDDESALGKSGVVAIILGATRIFRVKPKTSDLPSADIEHGDGSLLWMTGDFQKEFTHEVPPRKRIKETRISLTFRHHTK